MIKLIGEVNEEMLEHLVDELNKLAQNNIPKKIPVNILLTSAGGTGYDALAIAAVIRRSSRPIHITAYGLVASAAVLILAAGDKRMMTREAWVMVHEDLGKIKGNVVELERDVAHWRRMEDQWAELLADVTNTEAEKWTELHKKTTYLSAYECLKLGLIEEVV